MKSFCEVTALRARMLSVALGVLLWLSAAVTTTSVAQNTASNAQCEEAWAAVLQENTLASYQTFLDLFSTCPQANDARRAVEQWSGDREVRGGSAVAPPSASSTIAFPDFPWPPPRPSDQTLLPRARLLAALDRDPSLYEVGEHLSSALDDAGYFERSYYGAPGGFALIARLERFMDNGRPAPEGARYLEREPFSITDYLTGLFVAPVGRYRLIVFVVTDTSFTATGDAITQREANELLREGANRLPAYFRSMPFSADCEVTALIYEFERTGQTGQMRQLTPGRLGARTHLNRAGVYSRLIP